MELKERIYQAVKGHYIAERDKAIANIRIHVENPVGVGEHPKIVEDVIAEVHKASEAEDSLTMLNEIFEDDFG